MKTSGTIIIAALLVCCIGPSHAEPAPKDMRAAARAVFSVLLPILSREQEWPLNKRCLLADEWSAKSTELIAVREAFQDVEFASDLICSNEQRHAAAIEAVERRRDSGEPSQPGERISSWKIDFEFPTFDARKRTAVLHESVEITPYLIAHGKRDLLTRRFFEIRLHRISAHWSIKSINLIGLAI